MQFEHDAMISYSWRDNQPPPLSKQEGWVSAFQEGLEFWLKQLMPRAAKIWRDQHQMQGNKMLVDELNQVVGKCAVLLTVMSEPYLASEWCERELNTFLELAEQQGGVRVDNDYRVFRINKLPVKPKSMPQALNVVMGFDFYEIDPESRFPTPIDPSFGESEQHRFIRKVYDVAVALSRLLTQIEERGLGQTASDGASVASDAVKGESKASSTSAIAGPTVFLPYTTRDLSEVRDVLVGELMRRNCVVLPQEQIQFEEVEEFHASIAQDLARCELSIHLIGARYGNVLGGATQSDAELQNEWAAAESSKRGLRRLIWIPKELGVVTGKQALFIEELHKNRKALAGADLMQDSVEVLKGRIAEMIKPQKVAHKTVAKGLQIYLLHEESDKESVREIRKFFKNTTIRGQAIRLVVPVFDGDAVTRRELQRHNFLESDTVIVFWNRGSQAWVETSLNELRKVPASGRAKPFLGKHLVYLTGNLTSAKEDWWLDYEDGLIEDDVTTVQAIGETPEQALDEYLKTLDT